MARSTPPEGSAFPVAARGVYVDYLERWAWTVDSRGQKSEYRIIHSHDERMAIESELQDELDREDPIPSSAFSPAPLRRLHLL